MSLAEELGASLDTRVGTTSSSPYSGSPTFDAAPFQVEAGKQPRLGVYAFIEHDDRTVHYGRVIQGTEENPRADPARLQQNQAYQIGQRDPRIGGDRSPNVTRVMTLEVLGQITKTDGESLTSQEPNTLPQTGRGVFEMPADRLPWLLGLPDSPEDGPDIGLIESGGSSVPCIIPAEALVRQIAVAGKTGVGKTYAVGIMVEEFARLGITTFAADVLGDLVNATEDLGGRNYRAGKDFRVHYAIVGSSEMMAFLPNLTKEQAEIVSTAYDAIYSEAMAQLRDRGTVTVSFDRFFDAITDVAAQFGQVPVGGRAVQRVKAALNRTDLLTDKVGDWLTEFTQKPLINIFIGHLGQRDRNLTIAAAARLLQTLRRRDKVPPFMFILDEAHFFLPSGSEWTASTGVIRELVRTARHDAIGIVLITQSPSSMDRQALLTCNTRLVFALDKDDVRVVSGTMGDLPEAMVDRIPKMAKGTAILSSSMDIIRHPVLVRIRSRKTREGAPTPNLVQETKKWRQQNQNS